MRTSFTFSRTPNVVYGAGALAQVGALAARYGKTALVVTGGSSLERSGKWEACLTSLRDAGLGSRRHQIDTEPSPGVVDQGAAAARQAKADVVIAVGGGSVVDAGKAIAAMTPLDEPVADYLEGVGSKTHPGTTLPLIAVPTTAGTGSEATKNAVISEVGPEGYKKSLRHENFIPAYAVLDPELSLSCPPEVTAACGMDALTQLIESYVSIKANAMTDALALTGIERCAASLVPAVTSSKGEVVVRGSMALAAYFSGVCLANAGLGVVHGLASTIGGKIEIPHGVVCGSLLAPACYVTVDKLRHTDNDPHGSLARYARIGGVLAGTDGTDTKRDTDLLLEKLEQLVYQLGIPKLGVYGLNESDIEAISRESGTKNNPGDLGVQDIEQIIRARL